MPRTENGQQVEESSSSALSTLSNISKSQNSATLTEVTDVHIDTHSATLTEATDAHIDTHNLTPANRRVNQNDSQPQTAIEKQQQYNRDNFAANDRTIQSSKITLQQKQEEKLRKRGKTEKLSKNNFNFALNGNQIIGNKELRKEILYAIEKFKIICHLTSDDEKIYSVGKYHISLTNMNLILHHQCKMIRDKINAATKLGFAPYGEVDETDPWAASDIWDTIENIDELNNEDQTLRAKAQEFFKDEKDSKAVTSKKKSKKTKKYSKNNTIQNSTDDITVSDGNISSSEDEPIFGTTQVEIHNTTMSGLIGNIETSSDSLIVQLRAELATERQNNLELNRKMDTLIAELSSERESKNLLLQKVDSLTATVATMSQNIALLAAKQQPSTAPLGSDRKPAEVTGTKSKPPVMPSKTKKPQQQVSTKQTANAEKPKPRRPVSTKPNEKAEEKKPEVLISEFTDTGLASGFDIDAVEKQADLTKVMNNIINQPDRINDQTNAGVRPVNTVPITKPWNAALAEDLKPSDQTTRVATPVAKPPLAKAETLIVFTPKARTNAARISDCPPKMIAITWRAIKKDYPDPEDRRKAVLRYYSGSLKSEVYTMRLKWEKVYGKKIYNPWLSQPTEIWKVISANTTYDNMQKALKAWRDHALSYVPKNIEPVPNWYTTKIRKEKPQTTC